MLDKLTPSAMRRRITDAAAVAEVPRQTAATVWCDAKAPTPGGQRTVCQFLAETCGALRDVSVSIYINKRRSCRIYRGVRQNSKYV